MDADVLEKPDTRLTNDDGDHERLKHYVPKQAWERAALWGEEAVALCGKKWLPTKDPDRFPLCPRCAALYERLG